MKSHRKQNSTIWQNKTMIITGNITKLIKTSIIFFYWFHFDWLLIEGTGEGNNYQSLDILELLNYDYYQPNGKVDNKGFN